MKTEIRDSKVYINNRKYKVNGSAVKGKVSISGRKYTLLSGVLVTENTIVYDISFFGIKIKEKTPSPEYMAFLSIATKLFEDIFKLKRTIVQKDCTIMMGDFHGKPIEMKVKDDSARIVFDWDNIFLDLHFTKDEWIVVRGKIGMHDVFGEYSDTTQKISIGNMHDSITLTLPEFFERIYQIETQCWPGTEIPIVLKKNNGVKLSTVQNVQKIGRMMGYTVAKIDNGIVILDEDASIISTCVVLPFEIRHAEIERTPGGSLNILVEYSDKIIRVPVFYDIVYLFRLLDDMIELAAKSDIIQEFAVLD